MAELGFLPIAFDPSYTGESGGTPRYVASPTMATFPVSFRERIMASSSIIVLRWKKYKIEYYTIANQKQARYNIDKKTKATATVQKIDFGCSHKEQIENRYPQWLKTLVCSAWRKLFE